MSEEEYIDDLDYTNGIVKQNKKLIEENIQLQQENQQLKDLYRKTCEHLFNIGNDELARYFQAQILECPIFTSQVLGDKE